MGAGAFIEPLVVLTLLFGGTWINRNTQYRMFGKQQHRRIIISEGRDSSDSILESGLNSPIDPLLGQSPSRSSSPSLLTRQEPKWRRREVNFFGFKKELTSPNTKVFQGYLLSRLLQKFPFLVEAWYWALIYWVYQLGRAFTAVTLVEGTVNVARKHALQLIHIEKRLHIFFELDVQHFFLQYPILMHWINRIYSFIHIPGTIAFLVWLFYFTTTRNRLGERQSNKEIGQVEGSPAGPALYEARRRTMAVCNLVAFVIFTLWPCMPPRLLSDKDVSGSIGEEARSYGFVDTVHGVEGESSVWTQNKFCNQYAAMPSLHFGYSLLIGLTICTIPLAPHQRRSRALRIAPLTIRLPSPRRLLCLVVGITYPVTILTAIIATANHFILDAVAGAMVCGIAWNFNSILLNLLVVEDYFLWCVRIHKPQRFVVDVLEGEDDEWVPGKGIL
ncbi:integral membrane protein [Patellaria atrata CBS 101060]|uniref:Integral membrane protein n=1 Tax=Patellaria atrata CBS 101060 TaxID=1346257 RepID=A0A9P4S8K8_9PEZI|nr:integral membrane protein [Patellaria atrata CBS 101060]